MESVRVWGRGWSLRPVREAVTFLDRWRGLRGCIPGESLLIATSSVHGFGMNRPFTAVALDESLRVTGWRLVRPNRVVWFRGCSRVLEIPLGVTPPPVGARLEIDRA